MPQRWMNWGEGGIQKDNSTAISGLVEDEIPEGSLSCPSGTNFWFELDERLSEKAECSG